MIVGCGFNIGPGADELQVADDTRNPVAVYQVFNAVTAYTFYFPVLGSPNGDNCVVDTVIIIEEFLDGIFTPGLLSIPVCNFGTGTCTFETTDVSYSQNDITFEVLTVYVGGVV